MTDPIKIKKHWSTIEDSIGKELDQVSYVNKFNKLVVKKNNVMSITQKAIKKLTQPHTRTQKAQKPRKRKITKQLSLNYARAYIRRVIIHAGIPAQDQDLLFKKIMMALQKHMTVKKTTVNAIAQKIIHEYKTKSTEPKVIAPYQKSNTPHVKKDDQRPSYFEFIAGYPKISLQR